MTYLEFDAVIMQNEGMDTAYVEVSFDISKLIMIAAFNEKAKTIAREMYPMMVMRPACQRHLLLFFAKWSILPKALFSFTVRKERTVPVSRQLICCRLWGLTDADFELLRGRYL